MDIQKEKRKGVLEDIKRGWWLETSLKKYGEDYEENFSSVTQDDFSSHGFGLSNIP